VLKCRSLVKGRGHHRGQENLLSWDTPRSHQPQAADSMAAAAVYLSGFCNCYRNNHVRCGSKCTCGVSFIIGKAKNRQLAIIVAQSGLGPRLGQNEKRGRLTVPRRWLVHRQTADVSHAAEIFQHHTESPELRLDIYCHVKSRGTVHRPPWTRSGQIRRPLPHHQSTRFNRFSFGGSPSFQDFANHV
jgi:hypothetical protein